MSDTISSDNSFLFVAVDLPTPEAYALAAGAAGVSVLALGQTAEAKVVHAYETEPNTPLKAGQTSGSEDALRRPGPRPQATGTLGLLAAGNAGMELWRREDPLAAA